MVIIAEHKKYNAKYKDETFGLQNKRLKTTSNGDDSTRSSSILFAALLYVVASLQRYPLQWIFIFLHIHTLM